MPCLFCPIFGPADGFGARRTRFRPTAGQNPRRPRSLSRPSRTIQVSNQNYTYGKRWFPNITAPYTQAAVPEPILTNAPRIEQMVKDGKLSISLQDAVDLALQNNLAIVISRYTPWLAEASILHTLSGGGPTSGPVGALGTIPALSFDPQAYFHFQHGPKDDSGE